MCSVHHREFFHSPGPGLIDPYTLKAPETLSLDLDRGSSGILESTRCFFDRTCIRVQRPFSQMAENGTSAIHNLGIFNIRLMRNMSNVGFSGSENPNLLSVSLLRLA